MKKTIALLMIVAVLLICITGCSRDNRPALYVYNWSDYMDQDIISAFEEQHNVRVVLDYFDSNESMYAKLSAGASGYDVIFPTSYMVDIMKSQGMLAPIQKSLIPNLKNLDERYFAFASQPVLSFSVPYMVSTTGIGYLASQVDEDFEPSWGVFGDEQYRGRMTMLNDMRETIGAALKYLGYSMNTVKAQELAAAQQLLIEWKANLAKFEAEQYKNGLVSGEFRIAHG
ncbi:MAG: spermidine/putrescine ABC transporter substrate-binding protein, partial [Spirochaetaceae bacterium]